ncbi:hypothetical protein RintRC_0784 [Richelia intracellularis]|nr:hypothetical protein RintRC_0784 [Richelia intracellularis]
MVLNFEEDEITEEQGSKGAGEQESRKARMIKFLPTQFPLLK